MNSSESLAKWIRYLLWAFAIHSFFVSLGLIFIPPEFLDIFGYYDYKGSFFQTQAGVFHLVMAVAYVMAAKMAVPRCPLIWFIVTAKSMAFVFLLTYFIFAEQIWIVAFSAFTDGAMALVLYMLNVQYLKYENAVS